MITKKFPLLLSIVFTLSPFALFAEIDWRCNGVNHLFVSQEDSDDIISNLGSNCARIQLGFNAEMDGLSGTAYKNRLKEEIQVNKEAIELFANSGMKTVVSFYSPPGGFQTRTAPAHHAMFSSSALQEEYLEAVELIVTEFGDDPNVIAIDLNNEPAIRPELLCFDCKKWEDLVVEAIAVARAVNPGVLLIAKSVYGDANNLRSLPFFNDQNIYYGYHQYLAPDYQHTGIHGSTEVVSRPAFKSLKKKADKKLSAFARTWNKKRSQALELLPEAEVTVPVKAKIFMTETAVSNKAVQPEKFITDSVDIIESIGTNHPGAKFKIRKLQRKCNRKRNAKKRRKCRKRVQNKRKEKLISQYLENERLVLAYSF